MEFKCSKCFAVKFDSEFPYAKERRHSWCKDCNAKAKKEARQKFRENNPRKKRIRSEIVAENGDFSCPNCRVFKSPDNFRGAGEWCKSCRAELEAKRRLAKGIVPKKLSVLKEDTKLCLVCEIFLPLNCFSSAERGLGGVSSYCKSCFAMKSRIRTDKEKSRQNTQNWRKQNRERHLAQHRLRMFKYKSKKEVTSDGTVTDDYLQTLYSAFNCFYCKEEIEPENRTADHKTALAKGGKHSSENLVMACHRCNSSKRDLSAEEFLERIKNDDRFRNKRQRRDNGESHCT